MESLPPQKYTVNLPKEDTIDSAKTIIVLPAKNQSPPKAVNSNLKAVKTFKGSLINRPKQLQLKSFASSMATFKKDPPNHPKAESSKEIPMKFSQQNFNHRTQTKKTFRRTQLPLNGK